MNLLIRVSALLITLVLVENRIYLYNTHDGLDIEAYDCALAQSLLYCRRPRESIDLLRDNDTHSCEQNDGQLHRFSALRSKNITVSAVLRQWKSSLERVEQFSRYLKNAREVDGYLCECLHPASFGKNCEYRLPVGERLEETLDWQLTMRENNPQEVQIYGDVVCYQTLKCDSGVLCLDWREICDGIQHCMSGKDEENCDLLEMNRCDQDEYRCMNGMCIPDQFFLDGELDCLDWSDEMPFKKSEECPGERVSRECDDHLCSPNEWSCGDGQCIPDRLAFQKWTNLLSCQSRRDEYFMCETHGRVLLWTMPNGRCYGSGRYEASLVANRSEEERCEYLLKCTLAQGGEKNCPCQRDPRCAEQLWRSCRLSLIQYPRKAIIAPYMSFLYDRTRKWQNRLPSFIQINGTVRCRHSLITVTKLIPFDIDMNPRQMLEEHFCRPSWSNNSSLKNVPTRSTCYRANESIDVCNEWNPCLSITRIRDGWKNCLNGSDEVQQTGMESEKSCAGVRRHRFRCSIEEPRCLSVTRLGSKVVECQNRFDELWFGDGRELSSMNCHDQTKDECWLLREYVDQSWRSMNNSEMSSAHGISFRTYCDTFWDLHSREDENLLECRRQWICPEDQWQCQTGQCIEKSWRHDGEWDCADASDAHDLLKTLTYRALEAAALHDFRNRSYSIPLTCDQSQPFLCLSAKAIRQGFSCFNLSQIGDGHIDCAGGMDERNTLRRCSQSSTLGYHFHCSSTNTCIHYLLHCFKEQYRCPNRSDDEHRCDRQQRPSRCSRPGDFTCFNGQCVRGGWCNLVFDCSFGEDEYMCFYYSSILETLIPYRELKRLLQRAKKYTVRLSLYPSDAEVTEPNVGEILLPPPPPTSIAWNVSSVSPYWCNRGLGLLLRNHSIVCFCPPQYYGEKCEYHADRLSVVLRLNLSHSTSSSGESDAMIPLKLVVLFLFNNQTLNIDQFHLHPLSEMDRMKKMITHFPHPHSSSFRPQNDSSIVIPIPFGLNCIKHELIDNHH